MNRDIDSHGRLLERDQTGATVDEKERGFCLHDLYDKGKLFYSPASVNTEGGELATVARLDQLLVMVWATSGASPAAMTAPVGVVDIGEALGVVVLAWIVVKQCGVDEVWSWVQQQGKVA
jgi:hypothetical protein